MARLSGTRNLGGMAMRWRIGLVAIIAAAVVGGFLPHGALSAVDPSATQVVRTVEAPLSGTVNCADATCGKGNTAPAAPSPGIALGGGRGRHSGRRGSGAALRADVDSRSPCRSERESLFHPPQFS